MAENRDSSRQLWVWPVTEMVVVFAILSALVTLLVPAVNAALDSAYEPVSERSWFLRLASRYPGAFIAFFPLISMAGLTSLLLLFRRALPPRFRHRIPWTKPKR